MLVFVKSIYIVILVTGVKTVFDICIHLACINITECSIVLGMSKEELARQIKHMETQMNLLRQAHDEERKELNNTISTLEANVREQSDVESRLTRLELSLSQSLENKDVLRGTSSRYVSGESNTVTEGAEHEMTMVNVGGREFCNNLNIRGY